MTTTPSFHKKSDLQAAEKVMRARLDVLQMHIGNEDWAAACADLRAVESECINASRMAATLSFHAEKNRWAARHQ
jgi:hypothetical protein